jgi:hypothetical protein
MAGAKFRSFWKPEKLPLASAAREKLSLLAGAVGFNP